MKVEITKYYYDRLFGSLNVDLDIYNDEYASYTDVLDACHEYAYIETQMEYGVYLQLYGRDTDTALEEKFNIEFNKIFGNNT